ncbi:alpha/beta hydrolase [Ferrimonas senticii]|uniref:alpha/beta hydrolase n=1 Tax=Ferrimonas senticii TaxID=394566 RepID=UPI0012EB145A|nr:alpha/beta hydrolase [Ferrimonas senticii]
MLQLVVGQEAKYQIERHGLIPSLFDKWLGASGGPKWLPLAPLERHLSQHFIGHSQPMTMLGTSSGAWRCTTLCHPEPEQAHLRLQQGYIHQWYAQKPSQAEVERQCRDLLAKAIAGAEPQQLLSHPNRHLNLIVCRGKGIAASEHRGVATLAAACTMALNLLGREQLGWLWQRWVLHAKADSPFIGMRDLLTHNTQLTADGLLDAMLATGSIPVVLRGVADLPNTEPGYYYDGGVTDYHLDLPALTQGGLSLYPHFYPYAAPGWFDKSLPWRRAKGNFRKVVMLVPSAEFVAQLPDGRLPDRHDFAKMDNATRIDRWQRSVELGEQLIDAFEQLRQDPSKAMITLK